jgi:hypothetical protein
MILLQKNCKKIYKTADKLDNDNSSKYYGAGIVDAYNAVQ